MKISSFMIALIVVGVVSVALVQFIGSTTLQYGVNYDNDTLEVFDASVEMGGIVSDVDTKDTNQSTNSDETDKLGAAVFRALDTMKVAKQSVNVSNAMITNAGAKVGLPSYFTVAFISMILIAIIIGVIVSALIKKDV